MKKIKKTIEKPTEELKKIKRDSVTIRIGRGMHAGQTRTFSEKDHGKDFEKLAEGFKYKFDGIEE